MSGFGNLLGRKQQQNRTFPIVDNVCLAGVVLTMLGALLEMSFRLLAASINHYVTGSGLEVPSAQC